MNEEALITNAEDTLGGQPVFAGTRVLVQTLWDYLERGYALDLFLEDFPTVSRQQAQQTLARARQLLMGQAA